MSKFYTIKNKNSIRRWDRKKHFFEGCCRE